MTPTPQCDAPESARPPRGRSWPGRTGWLLIPAALVIGGAAALLAWPSERIAAPAAAPSLPPPPVPDGPSPPLGYSVAGAAAEGFRVVLPGSVTPEWRVRKTVNPDGTVTADPATGHWLFRTGGEGVAAEAYAVRLPAPVLEDALWAELVRVDPYVSSPSLNVEGKSPATLGGRPALEVRVVENANWMYEHHPKEVAKPDEQALAAAQKRAKRWVYYVTADDRRVYVVRLERAGDYPDPGVTAAVAESFQLLR